MKKLRPKWARVLYVLLVAWPSYTWFCIRNGIDVRKWAEALDWHFQVAMLPDEHLNKFLDWVEANLSKRALNMTLKQLRSLTLKWQERLRLLDWDVKVRWANKDEEEDAWGLCNPDVHAKTATIVVARPDHPEWGNGDHPKDIEVILVHELMHLHFAPFDHSTGSPQETTEENIVNQVARLLIALDRHDESVMNGGRALSRAARIKKCQLPAAVQEK